MKKLRGLIALVLAGATMLSVAGCSGVKRIDDEDKFLEVLKNSAGIKKKDMMVRDKNTTYDGEDVEYLTFTEDGSNSYCYIRYEDADDAMDAFENKYDSFDDILDDNDFDGSHKKMLSKDQGYLVLDGDIEEGITFDGMTFFESDTEYYGGYYVNGNVYIEVYCINGSKRDKEKVNAVLKELGLPNP